MKLREWLRAMRRERDEVRGFERIRWALGIAWVAMLGLVEPAVAFGVVFAVAGSVYPNSEFFYEVWHGGRDSWIGALAITVPTAMAGLVAAVLVLRQHKRSLVAAYVFLVLVVACSVVSLGNMTPVRQFLDDWQRVTGDPRAAHHAAEIRWNAALGATVAAVALVAAARRRRAARSAG